jgi:MFS family permease
VRPVTRFFGSSSARRLLADIRPLRESPAFRRLWAGTALSSIGGSMTSFAVMLQVYDLTRSSAAVGAIGIIQLIPVLTLGLIGGSFADAVDRRRLVLVTSSCLAAVSAIFAAQAFLGLRQLWLLYVLAAVEALLVAINDPARRTFVQRLLPAERLAAGIALNHLSVQVSRLAGVLLAGVIAAAAGLRMCYLIDALSFGAALYGVGRMPAMPPLDSLMQPGLRAVAEGLRFIRRRPVLAAAFLADLDAMVLGMPVALFPALNTAHFGGSPQTLGLLVAGPAAGGLIGSALSGPAGRITRQGRAMLLTVAGWGAAIAGFGITRTLWLALLLLAIAGAADATSVVFRVTIVQLVTPDVFRGRVTSVDYVVGAGGGQLGNFEAGLVASVTSPTTSAVSGGIATVIGAALLRLAVPAFARYTVPSRADAPHLATTTADAPPADAPQSAAPGTAAT